MKTILEAFEGSSAPYRAKRKNKYPCSFFMEIDDLVLLVPRILHSSIKNINFKDMVR